MLKIAAVTAVILLVAAGCSVQTTGQTDEEVTSNVETALNAVPGIDADQIDVSTSDGVVTLDGSVNSERTKDNLGTLVKQVKGVSRVRNNLDIQTAAAGGTGAGQETTQQPAGQAQQPQQAPQGQQQQVPASADQVRSALKRSNALSGVNMNVRTQDGTVTLTGTVPNQASKELAGRIAAEQEGVRSVQNNLQVRQTQQ